MSNVKSVCLMSVEQLCSSQPVAFRAYGRPPPHPWKVRNLDCFAQFPNFKMSSTNSSFLKCCLLGSACGLLICNLWSRLYSPLFSLFSLPFINLKRIYLLYTLVSSMLGFGSTNKPSTEPLRKLIIFIG